MKKKKKKELKGKNFSLVGILILTLSITAIAAVGIPKYNDYVRSQKEKMALNFAALIAQAAGAYYSQNGIYPAYYDLEVRAPSGYTGLIGSTTISVSGDGSAGYVSPTDFEMQSVVWKK